MALLRTGVSEECISAVIRVTSIGERGTTLAVTSNRSTPRASVLVTANVVLSSLILVILMIEAISSSDRSVLTRATLHNIPEDGTLLITRFFFLSSAIDILK
jgi:hypothetical protein